MDIPRHNLSLINHAGHDLDANKYFQLKYFLSEKDKLEAVKQELGEHPRGSKSALFKQGGSLGKDKRNFEFMEHQSKQDIN